MNQALGLSSVKDKKCKFGQIIEFLGLQIDVASGHPVISLPEEKRTKYLSQVAQILLRGVCGQRDADALFGRLQFCDGAIGGKAHKTFLAPIYMQKALPEGPICERLREALTWFK